MTIFDQSQEGVFAYSLPKEEREFLAFSPEDSLCRKQDLPLPEHSELDLTRHFSRLERKNMGIDTNFYPLGSCTMKLNPRVNEQAAALLGFSGAHPLAPDETVQGNLQLSKELVDMLCTLCGMDTGTLVPNAGAQGEFCGVQMIQAYHRDREDYARTEWIVPDSAHGTNPATASMAGCTVKTVRSNSEGDVDIDHLKELLSEKTAGLMLTNPNTLGVFSRRIEEITSLVHEAGGLLYYDGANLNAIMEVVRPGDMGFDVLHMNLHKTFSTPHGGGGPGSAPVLCKAHLEDFLPLPHVKKEGSHYRTVWHHDKSIGSLASFRGNFCTQVRAYLYGILHGFYGLRKVSEHAVLHANYLKASLPKEFVIPYRDQLCLHEFVCQCTAFSEEKVRALDIAKRLLDYGIHAPTVYFPLIVKECFLIEPTETESLPTLDAFLEALESIVREIKENPELVKSAPHTMPVERLDEVKAAKDLCVHALT